MEGRFFSGDLLLRERIGLPFFVVEEEIKFRRPSGAIIRVPKGTESDLFSIPRAFRGFLSALQRSAIPAVLHDHAYKAQIFGRKGRAEADKLIVEAMQAVNMEALLLHEWSDIGDNKDTKFKPPFGRLKMAAIHAGLKVGGWVAYNRYRKAYDSSN